MPISVQCACGKKLQVKDELAGKRGKCPACGQVLNIPLPEITASDPLDLGGLDLNAFGGGSDPLGDPLGGAGGNPLGTASPAGAMLGGGLAAANQRKVAAAPETPWFLRWYVLAGAGGGVLLLVGLIVVLVIVLSGGGSPEVATNQPQPPASTDPSTAPVAVPGTPPPGTAPVEAMPATAPAATPEAAGPPIKIVGATGSMLEPGLTMSAEVEVDRTTAQEPIQFTVEGLPEKVTAAPLELPPNQAKAGLVFTAAADAAEGEFPVKILAKAGNRRGEQPLVLTVKKIEPPSILPITAVSLQPGDRGTALVTVERNGLQGPLQIEVAGLPAKVTTKPLSLAADQSAGTLEFEAAADAAEAAVPLRVTATINGRVGETTVQLNLEKFAFRALPLAAPVVWLQPQKAEIVEIKVQRRSYQGPIEIRVENLPDQVTASPLTIAAGQSAGQLQLLAAAEAKDRVRSARVIATMPGAAAVAPPKPPVANPPATAAAGTNLPGTAAAIAPAAPPPPPAPPPLIVRVKKGEGSLLPEVDIAPELAGLLRRGSFGGRLKTEGKQVLLDVFGGTPESEAAVLDGLRWLAAHQAEDGHWSLENYSTDGPSKNCDCKSQAENNVDKNNTAATAFGILPFLGAGITGVSAPESPSELADFKDVVRKGVYYLAANQKIATDHTNGDLGGGMYSHALGTIALCEAYALTKHEDVKIPAQKAVRYLVNAQHGTTGGWGYGPRQEGDTSVVGWVFLAIRSGQLSGMPIESVVLDRAGRFLNSTACGPEPHKLSRYCYRPGGAPTLPLTAAGLLSRQYLGWPVTRPELADGCQFLMTSLPPENATAVGPSYNYYYSTQVLHHMEGKDWDLWNHRMREHLIRTQEKVGHKKGSWSPEGCDHGGRGGRMYATALSLLTLEVYYRHLPLYRKITNKPVETSE